MWNADDGLRGQYAGQMGKDDACNDGRENPENMESNHLGYLRRRGPGYWKHSVLSPRMEDHDMEE